MSHQESGKDQVARKVMTELRDDITVTVNNGTSTSLEDETAESLETEDLRWGWGSFRPRWLQCFNSSIGLLVILSTCNFFYGMSVNGFGNAAITSLEKRFHFNSKQTGLMSSITHISSMIVTLFISFYGSFGNKPRCLGICMSLAGFGLILFAVPHFMVGEYDPPEAKHASQFCQESNSTDTNCRGDLSFSWSHFLTFLAAQMIAGAGGAALFSIGIAYLDENVNPKYTSVYIAAFYVLAFIGPSIGFIVAGQLLSTYVDITQPEGLNLSPKDPRWIGNWWIGSFVSGFLIFLLVPLMSGNPRQLPSARAYRREAIEKHEIRAKDERISGNLKDILPATKNLLLNPVYMYQTMGVWAQVVVGSGVGPFLFKLIRLYYGASPAVAGLGVGIIQGVSSAIGTFVGSFFGMTDRLKENCQAAAKYCFFLQILGMWMCFMFLVPGCEDIRISGTVKNSSYNSRCNCDSVKYVPVCAGDVTYYSACHAGCPRQNISSKTLTNCSIADQLGSHGKLPEIELGQCDRGCKNLNAFLAGFTLLLMFSYTNDIPGKIVTMRSVPENQRSYALGLQLFIWRAFGALPAPVIFGSFIDGSCILWRTSCGDKGDCLAYSSKDVVTVIIVGSLIFQIVSLVSFYLSWHYACKSSIPAARKQDHSHQNGTALTVVEQNGGHSNTKGFLVHGIENPIGLDNITEDVSTSSVQETKF